MHVKWKAEFSNPYPLNNGVIQGGCLSPLLFAKYLNNLLHKLKGNGFGSYIGRVFGGVLRVQMIWLYRYPLSFD